MGLALCKGLSPNCCNKEIVFPVVRKNFTGLRRTPSWAPSNAFGMNWLTDCEAVLPLMLSWLNGSKSLQPGTQKSCENVFPEKWSLFYGQINARFWHGTFKNPNWMQFSGVFTLFWCPYAFAPFTRFSKTYHQLRKYGKLLRIKYSTLWVPSQPLNTKILLLMPKLIIK